jgi:putative zinc finger/helix-turn-helix YgiT family protein
MCGKLALSVIAEKREVIAEDGAQLAFGDELTACSSCGERYYTYEQSVASSRARAGALRHHAGLLAPADIRAFREREGLTQAQLEDRLGTGAKTVVRWERGTVCQSKAADRLLRLFMANPANMLALTEASAVASAAAEPALVAGSASFVASAHFETTMDWSVGTTFAAVQGMKTITIFAEALNAPSTPDPTFVTDAETGAAAAGARAA